ncbi:hypothetical protein BDW66DRAFT_133521 [Aspergillus desertorum]
MEFQLPLLTWSPTLAHARRQSVFPPISQPVGPTPSKMTKLPFQILTVPENQSHTIAPYGMGSKVKLGVARGSISTAHFSIRPTFPAFSLFVFE